MREVIEQILDGTYDYEKGALDFSCTKLEIELHKGEIYEGSFKIYAKEGRYTTGYITTTDPRMTCLTDRFTGNEAEICFRFNGEWTEEGEVSKGEFLVVSNQGEYYLPYVVSVTHMVPQSSSGPIKNLFHFTNLAQSNWKEAVRFYYSPGFAYVMKGCETQVSMIYQGLSAHDGNEQNVEEFLIAMNKKQPVEYVISEEVLQLSNPQGVVETSLNIFRNGWGYTYLEVWSKDDFILLEKNQITDDEFLGNRFSLPVYIDERALHAGRNLGVIHLQNAYVHLQIPVEVRVGNNNTAQASFHEEKQKHILALMELYQVFRLKTIHTNGWIKESGRIIDKLLSLDDSDASVRLFQAHQLITKSHYNEAGWVLEHVGELFTPKTKPAMHAYYLYLNTLLKQEAGYSSEIGRQVRSIYKQNPDDWRVAWLLLFMDEEYSRDAMARWTFLEKQFERGCRSPLLYVEALQLVNTNPTLLRKLEAFELQVLNYGKKKRNISLELVEQLIYLCERVREYHRILLGVLEYCYGLKKDTRVLKEICTLLIKGNKTDKIYFNWFAKGVESELRITNLYEYFMLSMDLDKEPIIPKRVLLYFTYQDNLDYKHKAYLYYYIAKRVREYQDIYINYLPGIEMFVKEQVLKMHMNSHLAYLYTNYLDVKMIDEDMAVNLSTLLFAHEIKLEQDGIRSVVVCQPNHLKEASYNVMSDRVWVPLYGSESCILFENQQGCRLVKKVSYSIERMMYADKLLDSVSSFVTRNPALDIYMHDHMLDGMDIGTKELSRWMRMLEYPFTPRKSKGSLMVKVAQYYYAKDDKKHLTEYLGGVNGDSLNTTQRGEMIRYMVLCGQIDKGCEWLNCYGDSAIDDKILLRLLEVAIDIRDYEYVDGLMKAAYRLFLRGRFNSTTLRYLMKHYQGMSRELQAIWKASRQYSLDRSEFCERMIIQMLFSGYFVGEQMEIFKEYMQGEPQPRVVEAYLAKNCYDFFAKERLIQREILLEIAHYFLEGYDVLKVCKLAFLKYYAENKGEIQQEDEPVIEAFLDSLIGEGICLNSFLELRQYSRKNIRLWDKTVVEYHASPERRPKIYYLILTGNEEEGEYKSDYMESALDEVYYKEFVLFFGESLQYYIVEEENGEEKLTQSGTCHRGEYQPEESMGRYGCINDIIMSKELQDYNTFDTLLQEYYKREFMNQELFKLRK